MEKRIFISHGKWALAEEWAEHDRASNLELVDVATINRAWR
jgi:hypothetical protein